MMMIFLLLVASLFGVADSTNFTQEMLLVGTLPDGSMATRRKEGSTQGAFMGRGMILNLRIRSSGIYAYSAGKSGLGMFYRQYSGGNLGTWVNTAQLKPNDLPANPNSLDAEGSASFYAGIYQTTTSDPLNQAIIGNRNGMRMESSKFSIGGTPESKPFVIVSAFGHTYKNANNPSNFAETGQAYVFTGEYYHWTQATTLKFPEAVEDAGYHFGRTVSVDKQSMDTAAISCTGCDPGHFKTGTVSAGAAGSQGRGAVYIYRSSEATAFTKWTATQKLWPRHNMWYYFAGGFLHVDGNTLVADACKGAECTDDLFVSREYNAPATHVFVFVKQQSSGLWSEQQVLTDGIMEAEIYARNFVSLELHDDTIAMGYSLNFVKNTVTKGSPGAQAGMVLVWYPNKPNYEQTETFRHQSSAVRRDRARALSSDGRLSAALNQHQWSLQQFLRNEVAANDYKTYFGKYISISGDRMVIGARGSTSGTLGNGITYPIVSLYTRRRQGGQWSQQQVLIDTPEAKTDITGALIYNNVFTAHGVTPYVQYQSEMAHGKWKCLLVTMFDEFGDGWDGAKLRVNYADGTYDYYYPDCNAPNPLEFEYCPSMHHQGGRYSFEVVHHEEARFNWEIEWRVQRNLQPHKGGWGNASDVYVGGRHSKMSFYWNPLELAFEDEEVHLLLPAAVTCRDCPDKAEDAHRLLGTADEGGGDDSVGDGAERPEARRLSHAAKSAAPSVSPAPTMVHDSSALSQWEKLVMTTSNPLLPWFQADRTGTTFVLSNLEGTTMLRSFSQCGGGSTPLTHSCWTNYPEAIPDGEYIARIGGARAGQSTGLHTWSFCGVSGGQQEHLQFRVKHGQCYPVQRFTKTRYCSFRDGAGVLAQMIIDLGVFVGEELSEAQEGGLFAALERLLPNTRAADFTVSEQHRDEDGHMHLTVSLKLKLREHGLDPADFAAVSALEDLYNGYLHSVAASGALATELAASGALMQQKDVRVELVHFDTATMPRGGVEQDDDSPADSTQDVVSRDWLVGGFTPASAVEARAYSLLSYVSDFIATCGYIGLLVCVVMGARAAHRQYRQRQPQLERDLEAATAALQKTSERASLRGARQLSGWKERLLGVLDDFSDYVVDGDATHDAVTGAPLMAEVVLPPVDVDALFPPEQEDGRDEEQQVRGGASRAKKSPQRRVVKATAKSFGSSSDGTGSSRTVVKASSLLHVRRLSEEEEEESVFTCKDSGSSSSSASSSSESCSESSSSEDDEQDDKCHIMRSFSRK